MSRQVITLLTDFGDGSPYVASMKGVILSMNPEVALVDITHGIRPQDIRHGAWVLAQAARWFPPGTIHIAVIDPGVGGSRRIVYAQIGEQQFIAPDNGLLSCLAREGRLSKMVTLTEPAYWRPEVSATFHGRDIMAPVAAHLSLGVDPGRLGPPHAELIELEWPEAQVVAGRIVGNVIAIDSFGNLVTNIRSEQLADAPTGESLLVTCDEHETRGLFRTYADQPAMTLIALINSGGNLELAIVDDSAAAMLGVGVGATVVLTW